MSLYDAVVRGCSAVRFLKGDFDGPVPAHLEMNIPIVHQYLTVLGLPGLRSQNLRGVVAKVGQAQRQQMRWVAVAVHRRKCTVRSKVRHDSTRLLFRQRRTDFSFAPASCRTRRSVRRLTGGRARMSFKATPSMRKKARARMRPEKTSVFA